MSWLRDRVDSGEAKAARVAASDDPWVPAILAGVPAEVLRRLTYAVLDERDADDLTFVLTPWPHLDGLGRVRHRRADATEVSVDAPAWTALLAARRIPEVLRERPQRIGDAFAVLLAGGDEPDLLAPVGPVVDITADARDAARAAFYGAVASPLPSDAEAVPQARHRVVPVGLPAEWGDPVAAS
jgi:hypothetical protein